MDSIRPHLGAAGGQASAELVAVVALALLLVLGIAQFAIAGYALWSAGDAARIGARAEHVGGDVRRAALSALPGFLERGARIERGSDGLAVEVRVSAPAVLPALPDIPVRASAALVPQAAP